MHKNLKRFLINLTALTILLFLTRVIFQFPVEYLQLSILKQNYASRVFSKIDALKILMVLGIFFTLYYKKKISQIPYQRFNLKQFITYLIVGEFFVFIYYLIRAVNNLYHIPIFILWPIILIIFALAFLSFIAAVFNKTYLKQFYKIFKKQLIYLAVSGFILYNLLIFFQNQWELFSFTASILLFIILKPFYPITLAFAAKTPILAIGSFAVSIGAPCSGIDSMFLFFAFFAGIYALDHKKIKNNFFPLFIIGFIGVYIVNILRLLLLLLVGIHISPELAVGLFHTNAGWVFFVIYFLLYYWLIKRYIYK